jgi:hypothetical protein
VEGVEGGGRWGMGEGRLAPAALPPATSPAKNGFGIWKSICLMQRMAADPPVQPTLTHHRRCAPLPTSWSSSRSCM